MSQLKKCPNCQKAITGHPNKKFCSSRCKDKYHNRTNPRGFGLSNYMGSGVDRDTYIYYAEVHGGIPQFDQRGVYTGFVDGYFDNSTDCQNSDPYTPRDR